MEQLELELTSRNKLEDTVNLEFPKIMRVWDAFHYAESHDPCPGIKYYGCYYIPRTAKETKEKLTTMYPLSVRNIRKMTARQTRLVYHTIMKYMSAYYNSRK